VSLFSDRGARARVAVVLVALLGLGLEYARWAAAAEHGWRWALEAPIERDGSTMIFPLWEVTRVVGPDRYEISKIVSDIPVAGDARDLAVGDTVSIIGRFDAAGPVVRVEVRELHHLRKYKEALGILGLALVAAWVPFAFRVREGRVVERG
jgi:hypothetical protein